MTAPIRVAAGLAAALAIAIGSFVILNGTHTTDVGVSPSPSSSPAASGPLGSNVGESISPSSSHVPNGPLDGTSWTSQISAADTPSGLPQIAVGTWTLTFDAFDGSTLMTLGNPRGGGPGYPVTYGSNNEVTFPADPTCAREDGNPTGSSTSTYGYAITGNTLTFTLVTTDSCTARVVNLTAHPWTKAP